MNIIRLHPVFKHMIWGGNKLRKNFGYDVEGDDVGECWGISAHPSGDCTIAGGQYDGMLLSQLFNTHRELFGNIKGDRFPLLTKIIDAKADLSIQVHPDDNYACKHENGSFGKTECWYVLEAEPYATIIIGHNASSHEEMELMIREKRWSEFIREIPVKKGDFYHIAPGTVHAIKAGTVILETQQSSDITYRVYDYDRLSGGKPRQLHIEQSIDVISAPFVDKEPNTNPNATINKNMKSLDACSFFDVWKFDVDGVEPLVMDRKFMLVSVIQGEGYIGEESIKKGDHFILPTRYGSAMVRGHLQMIVSSPT